MTLRESIEKSSYKGKVSELMKSGMASEFIQPWYVPLPTNPVSTGMALGGIGNAISQNPAGETPAVHFIPGLQVSPMAGESIRMTNFFYAQKEKDCLKVFVRDVGAFIQMNRFYTLLDDQLQPLFEETASENEINQRLSDLVENEDVYNWNHNAIDRWEIPFSTEVQSYIDRGETQSPEFRAKFLLEFFDGALSGSYDCKSSLTCDFTETHISGQPTLVSSEAEYCAQYPISRQESNSGNDVSIEKYHYSSIVPSDEKLCSLPFHYSIFVIKNNSTTGKEVVILQTQENLIGSHVLKERPEVQDASFLLQKSGNGQVGAIYESNFGKGVIQSAHSDQGDIQGKAAIVVQADDDVVITCKPEYYHTQEEGIVDGALSTGRLSNRFTKGIYTGRELQGSAISAKVTIPAGSEKEIVFVSVYDFESINLPGLESRKKYTEYFSDKENRISEIIEYSLRQEADIRKQVLRGQENLVPDDKLSMLDSNVGSQNNYRTLMLNTLSFLAEATVWDAEDRFLVRECADYPFFNSLDVYFYGSFSLLKLLPRLDGEVMMRFADAVLAEDLSERRHWEYVGHPCADLPEEKLEGPRAVRGAVIHDLGSPFDTRPDAYDWHNVKEWKDLAPKFIMMVLRHYKATGNQSILEYCWEAVHEAMAYLEAMVEPGQNFPLTRGTDDTFDNLSSHGISVYCGSLWIAGLRAYAELCGLLGKEGGLEYKEKANQANVDFQNSLWDEEEGYYHFYVTPVTPEDVNHNKWDTLRDSLGPIGLSLEEDQLVGLTKINQYLCEKSRPVTLVDEKVIQRYAPELIAKGNLTKRERRTLKKLELLTLGNGFWSSNFEAKILKDSDEVFADQMLADTYSEWIGLEPISTTGQKKRCLNKVFEMNYRVNSPHIGAANMVRANGDPMEEDNFQAHDVWVGVQHSIITGLLQIGDKDRALELLNRTYDNIYDEAKIPFGAPEGFNGSCRLTEEVLIAELHYSEEVASQVISLLKEKDWLHPDGRVSITMPKQIELLNAVLENGVQVEPLFRLIHGTAMKYTAGRYFRPGMVFALWGL